jgi:hypothetical protein
MLKELFPVCARERTSSLSFPSLWVFPARVGKKVQSASAMQYRKQFVLSLVLAVLPILSGCAHRYLLTLRDGAQIIAISKPKLEGANYHFRHETGGECVISKERVAKIATGTVETKQENEPTPAAAPSAPKKNKHWYFLWLA